MDIPRIVRYQTSDGPRLGAVIGEDVSVLHDAEPSLPTDLSALLRLGDAGMEALVSAVKRSTIRHRLADLTLLPPSVTAGKMLCLGLNYRSHASEAAMAEPDFPVLFARFSSSLVGHNGSLICPSVSTQLDWEGEIAAFIGRRVKHVSEADALDAVAGYTIFNDASVRDYQLRTTQWTVGKNFDGTGGFGPTYVPASQLPRGAKGLMLETRVNGTVMQHATTSDMLFDVARTVSLLSKCMVLEPGDVLVMGTPEGVGAVRKPPIWLKPGDICEVEVEQMGLLRNSVVAESV